MKTAARNAIVGITLCLSGGLMATNIISKPVSETAIVPRSASGTPVDTVASLVDSVDWAAMKVEPVIATF